MGFFKESGATTSSKAIARLQQLIWVLIYGGLLTLVLGLSLQRMDDALGWSMVVGGGIVAAIGFLLIYVRSRLTPGN
ncbi:hypothetical protein [Polaromonas sp.]|uniref:hypothetical protein n=1 Tax=Polaromonas sp. TaxID=1869339 RepID=UPI003753CC7A